MTALYWDYALVVNSVFAMASKRGMRLEIEKVEMKGKNTVEESAGSWGLTAVVGLDNSRVLSYMVAE